MTSLVLDFESTMPGVDIRHHGLFNYIAAAEPLCVAWAVDDGPVELIDFTERGCYLMPMVASLLRDPHVIKIAQNIAFERALLRKLGLDTPISQWVDTSVLARHAGMPSKLKDICKALKLGDLGKHTDGTRLINKFCKPKKDGTYRDKTSDPEDWQKFLDYCRRDVVAEREVYKRLLPTFSLPDRERRIWELDDKINRRGWPVDMEYVRNAHKLAAETKAAHILELKKITGLDNPNSRDQFLGWARSQGYEFNSLGKSFIKQFEAMLEEDEENNDAV